MNRFVRILMFVLAGVLLSACRSESEGPDFRAPGKLYVPWNTQYSVGAKGGTLAVPVTCEGAWTASCSDDWVSIVNPEGMGSDTIRLSMVANGSGYDRVASLRICLGNDEERGYSVTLDQPTSSALFVSNGIVGGAGYSYDISKDYCKGVSYAIFDIDYLDSIQQRVNQYFIMDDWTPYSEDQYFQGETESSVSHQISASATLELNTLIANASVQGTVTVSTAETENNMYAMMRTKRVVFMRDLQFSNIIQYYRETGDSCVFAMGFFNDWKNLQSYEEGTTPLPTYKVVDFLNKWGLGFVSRSYMGGCVDYKMAIDKSVLTEKFTVKIAANLVVQGGVLNADGSVELKEEFEKVKDHYSLDVEVSGGDVQSISSIVFGSSITMLDLEKWMESVSFSEDGGTESTAVMVDMKLVSMANLFTGKVRDKVKQVIDNMTELK